MKFGFTGTRAGMAEKQHRACISIFENYDGKEIHHGDCIGSDYEIHQAFIYRPIDIIVHPPIVDKFRAYSEMQNLSQLSIEHLKVILLGIEILLRRQIP